MDGGGGAAVVLVVAAVKFKPGSTEYSDFMVGIASAVLIFALLRSRPEQIRDSTRERLAGSLVFPTRLYVVHLPALVFISAWLVPQRRWQPDAVHIAMVAGLGICALAYAFAIARLTEYRTDVVRSRVNAAIGRHG